jgi:hypothetical protein
MELMTAIWLVPVVTSRIRKAMMDLANIDVYVKRENRARKKLARMVVSAITRIVFIFETMMSIL